MKRMNKEEILSNYNLSKEMVFDHTVLSHLATKFDISENIENIVDSEFSVQLLLEDNFENYSWKIFKIDIMGEDFYHILYMYPGGYGDYCNCKKIKHLEFVFLDFIEPLFKRTTKIKELQLRTDTVKKLVAVEEQYKK
ncbi:hypothetical protein PB1_02605 [Bacillus methanolicus PB1]|uniref:Uncharacterized protein n=1 Tax=Bacillus methanolicus PB1 TaxID=997296 RepID=I3E5M3_BACMT|nr:hypothetical protein [Bacillus methanolicus]EIJ81794.1 hypothetical protein PB1_02605 [Bacillus methanolicus PB1]